MSSTQQLQFDTIESPYGPKLAVQFGYDKQTVAAIKRLSWSRTHRSYNDPSDDDAIVGYRCWTVDHTEDALEALEHHLDTAVPAEHWPGSSGTRSGGAGVQLVVPAGSGHFRVETDASRVLSLLDSAFSYPVEDAEYTDAYKNGDWDGREHLFSKRFQRAPVGLLDQARSLIEREGYDVTVIREAPNTGRDIDTAWAFEHDLRPYQRETVQEMLDNDGGIVSLPTGTGKTVVGLRFINALESRSLILVHSRELLYQWADRIRSTLDVEPGIIGDGEFSQGPVTVATLQTLLARGGSGAPDELADDYGVVVFDECHRTSAAEQMHDLGTDISARYRVGLSATPWRRVDGESLKIEAAVGSVAHEVSAKSMIRQGYLANPTFEVVDPQEYGKPRRTSPGESYQEAKTRVIEADPTRITAIASRTLELANSGQQVLVNVNRRGHAKLIASILSEAVTEADVVAGIDNPDRERQLRETYSKLVRLTDTDAVVLTGNTANGEREQILDDLESGDQGIIISTILKEGVDIPALDAVVLAHGRRSDIETIQTIGRVLRPSGGAEARVVDVADSGRFFGAAYRDRQKTVKEYYELDQPPRAGTPQRAVA